jgi:4-hydroxy-3-methylbut-2-enyl diphosphate reductase
MEIKIAEVSGFCFGVERVIEMVEKKSRETPVDTLGPLIHNPVVVRELEKKGVKAISSLEETEKKAVVIRAHGVPPEVYKKAEKLNISLFDGTCPFVKIVQNMAKRLYEDGYEVVVVGKKHHPEVIGVVGYTEGKAHVVSSPEEARKIPLKKKRVGVVVQTTFRFDIFAKCVEELMKRASEVRVFNTRCSDTDRRQEAAIKLAKEVEVMIVVGGKNSSNTRRLYELTEKQGVRTYHIESPDELEPVWFKGVEKVGIIGGASTPQRVVEEVVERIKGFDRSHNF